MKFSADWRCTHLSYDFNLLGATSSFCDLLPRLSEPVFYTFELLWLNGEDVGSRPPIIGSDAGSLSTVRVGSF
jgi:hypothetical protein